MIVPLLVVEDGSFLDGLLGDRKVDVDDASLQGGGGFDGEFHRIEQGPGVAVGDVDEMIEGFGVDLDAQMSIPPDIAQCVPGDAQEFLAGQGLELEDAAAGNQRSIDREVGVLRGRADEDDGAGSRPQGNRASCWALLKRCTSSTKRMVRSLCRLRRSCASWMAERMSATPARTALMMMKWELVVLAMTWASVVLPVPGGP